MGKGARHRKERAMEQMRIEQNKENKQQTHKISEWVAFDASSRSKTVKWRNNGTMSYRDKIICEYLFIYGVDGSPAFCCVDCGEKAMIENKVAPIIAEYAEMKFVESWKHHHKVNELYWFMTKSKNPEYNKLADVVWGQWKNGTFGKWVEKLMEKHEDINNFWKQLECKLCSHNGTSDCGEHNK